MKDAPTEDMIRVLTMVSKPISIHPDSFLMRLSRCADTVEKDEWQATLLLQRCVSWVAESNEQGWVDYQFVPAALERAQAQIQQMDITGFDTISNGTAAA